MAGAFTASCPSRLKQRSATHDLAVTPPFLPHCRIRIHRCRGSCLCLALFARRWLPTTHFQRKVPRRPSTSTASRRRSRRSATRLLRSVASMYWLRMRTAWSLSICMLHTNASSMKNSKQVSTTRPLFDNRCLFLRVSPSRRARPTWSSNPPVYSRILV